ncbi:hypothetical protein Q3G72_026903 [Acer saccharum]|nr:hypothetical protein Q3G72_026903 [Acer saccharum]
MHSFCPLVSRLSMAIRTDATRILIGITSGIGKANRIIGTHMFSVKENKENNDSIPPVGDDSRDEDFEILYEWIHSNEENDTFLGGRHGRMVPVKVSRMMEVPNGILPCCIEETDKQEIYRLHMEDQEHNTPVMLPKAYGTSMETIDVILFERDVLNFSKKITPSSAPVVVFPHKSFPCTSISLLCLLHFSNH